MTSGILFKRIPRFGGLLIALCILYSQKPARAQAGDYRPGEGLLHRYVREAHRTGKTSVKMDYPISQWAQERGLDDALARTTVVVAKLIGSATISTPDEIYTWRKYSIIEKLSQQSEVPADLCDKIPDSLLPLKPEEFVVSEIGGTIIMDGVKLIQQDPRKNEVPPQDRHLMFLLFTCSGSIGLLNYGPDGHFSLDDSDNIHVSEHSKNRLKDELLSRTGGKLSELRSISAGIVPKSFRDIP